MGAELLRQAGAGGLKGTAYSVAVSRGSPQMTYDFWRVSPKNLYLHYKSNLPQTIPRFNFAGDLGEFFS